MSITCLGVCRGFENNGICDIPLNICTVGTDCADCQSVLPIWSIAGTIITVAFIGLAIYTLVLERRQRRLKQSQDESARLANRVEEEVSMFPTRM